MSNPMGEWRVFRFEIPERYQEEFDKEQVRILNNLELNGWEPRSIQRWQQNSVADREGITVYARRVL